jgi:hypothetical protein
MFEYEQHFAENDIDESVLPWPDQTAPQRFRCLGTVSKFRGQQQAHGRGAAPAAEPVVATSAALIVALAGVGVMIPSHGHAKGCIKGAAVGGLAGHLVHHGVAGAVAGCVVGHHQAAKQRREHEQQNGGPPQGKGK